MAQARFHFHGELNIFLPPDRRGNAFDYDFEGCPAVKHIIEALGVPHTEVAGLRVNEKPVDLSHRIQDGDRVEIYPFSATNFESRLTLPPGEPRFVLDNHLGRLAVYLRMLGFDSLYRNDYQDEELAEVSGRESRILLTRDRRLLMRSAVVYGHWVRSTAPREQLREVVQRYNLAQVLTPFRRCLLCNGRLEHVPKDAVIDQLEPLTRRYFDDFHRCSSCGGIFWKGSHFERMQGLIQEVLGLA